MKKSVFEEKLTSLIKQEDFEAAQEFLKKNSADIPQDEQTQPFGARRKMVFADEADAGPEAEGDGALNWANNYSRWIRKGRYEKMIKQDPSRLRIVDEGDSWYQYPILLTDIIDHVNRKFAVLSLSAAGDTADAMVLEGEYLDAIRIHKPDVFMFSAGGNDLLGEGRFERYLKPYKAGASARELVNDRALTSAINAILGIYRTVITRALNERPNLCIFVHGYGNVHPERGGKWLGKPLAAKGIPLKIGREISTWILERFNQGLSALANEYPANLTHFDLRDEVGEDPNSWEDELHPKSEGYKRAAAPIISQLHDLNRRLPELRARPETFAVAEATGIMPPVNAARNDLFANLRDRAAAIGVTPRMDTRSQPDLSDEVTQAQISLDKLIADFDLPERPSRVDARLDYSLRAGRHTFERIIGDNNLDEFYVLSRGVSAGRAVARIHARGPGGGSAFGTGFLIGDGLLITNNHVLQNREAASMSIASFDYEYDVDGMLKAPVHFALTGELFVTSVENDYTIVSVAPMSSDGTPLDHFGQIELLPRSGKALKKEFVNIIQHPRGDYKKVALRENLVVGREDQFLYYVTDTQAGSSGSPVLNMEWQLAAIHHMAIPDPQNPGKYRANRGVRVSAILDDITHQRNKGNEDAIRLDAALMRQRSSNATLLPKFSAPEATFQTDVADQLSASENDDDLAWAEAENAENTGEQHGAAFEASRPRLSVGDASWPNSPRNAPDTWHLPPEKADDGFTLTPALLQIMLEKNLFVPEITASGKLIFGLRGAQLAQARTRVENASAIEILPARVDHENHRCVMGVWDIGSGRIWAYTGSTVPRRTGVLSYYNRSNFGQGSLCNMLPTGCYEYCVGSHYSRSMGEVTYVLRQGNGPSPANASSVTTLRTQNDLVYGTKDQWDLCKPSDNIHPSFRSSSFSSVGCLTIPGKQAGGGASHNSGTGDWVRFRKAAGFDGRNHGVRYDLLLLTGHEAASFASGEPNSLQCLRHGSMGDAVKMLQGKLGLNPDGVFGAGTKKRLTEVQQDRLGYATGTYGSEMARLLGFDF